MDSGCNGVTQPDCIQQWVRTPFHNICILNLIVQSSILCPPYICTVKQEHMAGGHDYGFGTATYGGAYGECFSVDGAIQIACSQWTTFGKVVEFHTAPSKSPDSLSCGTSSSLPSRVFVRCVQPLAISRTTLTKIYHFPAVGRTTAHMLQWFLPSISISAPIIARVSQLMAELLVIGVTWWYTYQTYRIRRGIKLGKTISSLLFYNGNFQLMNNCVDGS